MLGLYLYTLKISHKSCNMSKVLNTLALQKGIANLCDKYCVFGQILKTQQQQLKKPHKNPCLSRGLNLGHLACKADALPLHQRVNREYRL